MTILYIAVGVCAVAVAVYFIRLGIDKRKLEDAAIRRSIEDEERQARMREPWSSRSSTTERAPYKREAPGSSPGGTIDDDTKTWPIMPGNRA